MSRQFSGAGRLIFDRNTTRAFSRQMVGEGSCCVFMLCNIQKLKKIEVKNG